MLPVLLFALAAAAPGPPPPVPGFPIGCLVHAAGDELEKARDAGFEYGEIGLRDITALPEEEFERLRARTKAFPLRAALNFLPAEIKVVGPSLDAAAEQDYLGRAFARARRLGIRTVVFGSGKSRQFPEGFSREEALRQLAAFGRRAAKEAQKAGVVIAIEALGSDETNTINTVAEAIALVRAVGHPSFGLGVDYYHLIKGHELPAALLATGKILRHVRIANPTGRTYPRDAAEADYAAFFGVLRTIGYRGPIGVEARTTSFATDAPRSVAFLRAQAATLARTSR